MAHCGYHYIRLASEELEGVMGACSIRCSCNDLSEDRDYGHVQEELFWIISEENPDEDPEERKRSFPPSIRGVYCA